MKTYLLCVVFCAVSGLAASAKLLTIPLVRTDSPIVAMLKQNIHPKVIEAMMLADSEEDVVPVPLRKYMDSDFYGEVLFGHPGQEMRMAFDTTWLDAWVPASTCAVTSISCAMRHKYDPSRSSFAKPTKIDFNVPIGRSNLTGRVWYDLVHVNQVNITNQGFAAVWTIPWAFMFAKYDGILGMGLGGENNVIVPIIHSLAKQKLIDKKVFSVYFNRNPLTSKGGTLLFGGVDQHHYKGNFTYVDLVKTNPAEWVIRVDEMVVSQPKNRSFTLCEMGCNATMSTCGNPINGPRLQIDDINIAIGARKFHFGRYSVDCSTIPNLPKVTIVIGGRKFVLGGKDYVQQISIPHVMTICLSSFASNYDPNDEMWYLGGAFMSKYYTTFDVDEMRVGFADAQL